MSSACLIVKQSPFVVAPPRSRLITTDTRPQTNDSSASLWRPWLLTNKDAQQGCHRGRQSCPYSRPAPPAPGSKSQTFQHPVRLFWPKSKSFDYLYSDGEALLNNFPVQATISFYDESDSEDEEDDWEEEGDSEEEECLKPQTNFTTYN